MALAVLDLLTDPQHRDKLLDIDALAVAIPAITIRRWVAAGLLRPAGRRGQAHLYRVGDVTDLRLGRCPASTAS
jgi:hypothetical protein